MESKLNQIDIINNNTGELLDVEVIERILKEENNIKYKKIFYKLYNHPESLTLEEIEIIKKNDKVYLNSLKNNYIRISKIKKDILLNLDMEVLGYVTYFSLIANRDGVLRYGNNKLIPSFNKLREELEVSHHKWTKIKKVLSENEIIKSAKFDGKKFLVMNPLYSNSHNEIDTYRFIAFHNSLKFHLNYIDYLYLSKKFEIVIDTRYLYKESEGIKNDTKPIESVVCDTF